MKVSEKVITIGKYDFIMLHCVSGYYLTSVSARHSQWYEQFNFSVGEILKMFSKEDIVLNHFLYFPEENKLWELIFRLQSLHISRETNEKKVVLRSHLMAIFNVNACKPFNNHIKELLLSNTTSEMVDVTSKLELLDQCNPTQLGLLKSIGIEPVKVVQKWDRTCLGQHQKQNHKLVLDFYTRDIRSSISNKNIITAFGYETKELAIKAGHKFSTIQLMENWVRFHAPDWTPTWGANSANLKYGIRFYNYALVVGDCNAFNSLVFHITVPTEKLACEMLAEFKNDLEEIFNLK